MKNLLTKLIVLAIFVTVASDCGCDKLSRAAKYERESDSQTLKLIQHTKAFENMSLISAGSYFIGTNEPVFETDRESPERQIEIEQFYLDKYEVSNREFKLFTEQTKYITEAEKFGDSFVFKMFLTPEVQQKYEDFRVQAAVWWYKIKDASCFHPEGPESNINDRMEHPVVHVSWNDASAYCKHYNKRLPTEAEFEVGLKLSM